ncbi:hypothetical protein SCALM49S_00745 [Streptomyces californicus]
MQILTSAPARTRSGARHGGAGRALAVGGGVALLALALTGCGSTDVDEAPVERKSFALEGKTLTVDAENGAVDLVPADVEQVEVERQFDGWVMFGSGPDAVWKMEGDTLTLRVKCEGFVDNCDSRHRVKVPRRGRGDRHLGQRLGHRHRFQERAGPLVRQWRDHRA